MVATGSDPCMMPCPAQFRPSQRRSALFSDSTVSTVQQLQLIRDGSHQSATCPRCSPPRLGSLLPGQQRATGCLRQPADGSPGDGCTWWGPGGCLCRTASVAALAPTLTAAPPAPPARASRESVSRSQADPTAAFVEFVRMHGKAYATDAAVYAQRLAAVPVGGWGGGIRRPLALHQTGPRPLASLWCLAH